MASGRQTGAHPESPAATALLAAAGDLLAERTPTAVSGRELADRAGVNYGLIHRHFGSKNALLAAALEQLGDDYAADGLDANGCPIPLRLSRHDRLWRGLAHVLLDAGGFDEYRRSAPVLVRCVTGIRRARPELDDRQIATVVGLALSIEMGLPLHRSVLARAVSVPADSPAIDRLVEQWLDGLYHGGGPLGALPVDDPGVVRSPGGETAPFDDAVQVGDRLVEAGARLLADRAPSAISGRRLAEAAGVNYGLIHHYFGSKDEVLRRSVQLHRNRYFEAHRTADRSPRFFSVCDHPGYVRAMTWSALDPTLAVSEQVYPVTAQMLERLVTADTPPETELAIRVAILVAVAAQMTWALARPLMSLAFELDPRSLEPMAASLLRSLLLDATAGSSPDGVPGSG